MAAAADAVDEVLLDTTTEAPAPVAAPRSSSLGLLLAVAAGVAVYALRGRR